MLGKSGNIWLDETSSVALSATSEPKAPAPAYDPNAAMPGPDVSANRLTVPVQASTSQTNGLSASVQALPRAAVAGTFEPIGDAIGGTAIAGAGSRTGDDPLLYRQWYIDRTGMDDIGIDMNIRPVWDGGGGQGYTGAGVTVGVFDSLIERNHPDLEPSYNESLDVEALFYEHTDSAHGTAVAGIIAAAKNGLGMTGIAYDSKVTSLPVIYSTSVAMNDFNIAMEHAKDFDIANFSLGGLMPFDSYDVRFWFQVNGHHYKDAVEQGRDGLGTLLIQGAGNNRTLNPLDANLSNFQNQRYSITVSAVDAWGLVADYSSEGANMLVAAASSGSYFGPYIATTDMVGDGGYNKGDNPDWEPLPADYTTRFGGTSAATPVISGITALILEANPELGWRDVRDILAFSARHTGVAIGGTPEWFEAYTWKTNGSNTVNGTGLHYNQNYGFGLVDGLAAVRLAESWTRQRTSTNEVNRSDTVTQNLVIPESPYNTTPLVIDFDIEDGVTAQIVTLYINLTHGMSNELEVRLFSPSGTESLIFTHKGFGPNIYGTGGTAWTPWTFTSNNFVGENATGTWRLEILDNRGFWPANGVFKSATLTVYGDATRDDNDYIYTNEFGILAGMNYGYAMIDPAGIDTLNAAAVTSGSLLDLRGAHNSRINGLAVTIGAATVIEKAWGGDGADVIYGNGAANTLNGMRGHDTIAGGAGDDTLEGGSGDDVILGGKGADLLKGGTGNDTLSYSNAGSGVVVDLQTHTASGGDASGDQFEEVENVRGGSWNDHLTGDDLSNRLTGGSGADTLIGNGADDQLDGGDGADSLVGGLGNDVFSVESQSDFIVELAGEGTDTVKTNLNGYILGATLENLILTGGANINGGGNGSNNVVIGNGANNLLLGGKGDDVLKGGNGDDFLDGGTGFDYMSGGAGNDTYRYGSGDRIVESENGGTDLVLSSVLSMTLGYGLENVTLFAAGVSANGNSLNNVVTGNDLGNTLQGGGGNDTINGMVGNDVINGGKGADLLSGGTGNDTFVYNNVTYSDSAESDRIIDFAAGDILDLHLIDANVQLSGDQAFFHVSALTGQAGELVLSHDAISNITTLVAVTKGGDLMVQLSGNVSSTEGWLL